MIVAVALLAILVVVMALTLPVVVVVMMMLRLFGQAGQLGLQGVRAFHGLQKLCTRQVIPGGGDDNGGGVVLTEQAHSGLGLVGRGSIGVGEDDAAGVLHLVIEEFAKILHVHLALTCVHHGGKAVQDSSLGGGTLDGADDIGQLAHARRLDKDTVGGILGQHLGQGLAEVTHQGATNATRVHLVDLNACLGQKTAVNTDLTEFVLDEDQLLACVGLGDELLDKGSLTGTQKAGENVDLCHDGSLLCYKIMNDLRSGYSALHYTPFFFGCQGFLGKKVWRTQKPQSEPCGFWILFFSDTIPQPKP